MGVDKGPDFAGRMHDQWAHLNKVELDFSRPGQPRTTRSSKLSTVGCARNASTPSSSCRWDAARQRITDWRIDYNEERPHSALGNLTPSAFAAQLKPARKVA